MTVSYRNALIHDVALLVKDSLTGKLRFGVRGKDHPDRCVVSAGDLPDCEMTLHVFEYDHIREQWEKTLPADENREILRSDGALREPSLALVMRLDRPRRAGDTLSDVVAVERAAPKASRSAGAAPELFLGGYDPWGRRPRPEEEEDRRARWLKSRERDIAVLEAAGYAVSRTQADHGFEEPEEWGVKATKTVAGLDIEVVLHESWYGNRERGEGLTVRIADRYAKGDPLGEYGLDRVYEDKFRKESARLGLVPPARRKRSSTGGPFFAFPEGKKGVDAGLLATFETSVAEVGKLKESYLRRQRGETALAKVFLDREVVNLAKKAYAGCPPHELSTALERRSQVTPKSGNSITAAHAIVRAEHLGFIERCWEGHYFLDPGTVVDAPYPDRGYLEARGTVWGLTELGRALAEEDMDYLEEHFVEPSGRRAPQPDRPLRCPTREDLPAVNRYCSPELMRQTRKALELKFAALEGAATAAYPFEGHLIVTGLALGVFRIDVAHRRVELMEPSVDLDEIVDAAPSPGGP